MTFSLFYVGFSSHFTIAFCLLWFALDSVGFLSYFFAILLHAVIKTPGKNEVLCTLLKIYFKKMLVLSQTTNTNTDESGIKLAFFIL